MEVLKPTRGMNIELILDEKLEWFGIPESSVMWNV